MTNKWDKRFMGIAADVASWSKDPDCQVGAVLVKSEGRQVSWGYNGLPKGIPDKQDILQDKERKNLLMVHAEANALLNAPFDTHGGTLYVTKAPCCSKGCAQAVIQAGVKRLVCPEIDLSSSWCEDQTTAFDLLETAGVEVVFVEDPGE